MRDLLNQAVYYVPSVRLLKDNNEHKNIGINIKAGEYPINQDNIFMTDQNPDNTVFIMINDVLGCNILPIKLDNDVEVFTKIIKPKYQLGEIVCNLDDSGPFRIYQYTLMQGRIWYRNGWCMATGNENGRYEEAIKSYTGPSDKWDITFYDSLVKEKDPQIHRIIMEKAKTIPKFALISKHPVIQRLIAQATEKFADFDMNKEDHKDFLFSYLTLRLEVDYKEGKIPILPEIVITTNEASPGFSVLFNPVHYKITQS